MNNKIFKSIFAGFFSFITILILTVLSYKTEYGIFLIASFGSTMVLLYGYPESPFAQPKNIFGHLITALAGLFFIFYTFAYLYFNTVSCWCWCIFNDIF